MPIISPIYRSSPNSPTGEQVSYDNGKTWQTYFTPREPRESSGGGSSRKPATPKEEPKKEEIPIKSAVYIKDYGGQSGVLAYDSTKGYKFYPTKEESFMPMGYERGFLDVREKEGKISYSVVPEKYVQYAKSTKEGVSITFPPKKVYEGTGKSYNPKNYVDLGNNLVLKIPKPKPKQESVFKEYLRSQTHVLNIFTGGAIPSLIESSKSAGRTLLYVSGSEKITAIPKVKKPSLIDVATTSLFFIPTARALRRTPKTEVRFLAEVLPKGSVSEVYVLSGAKTGSKEFLGLGKSVVKETEEKTSLAFSRNIFLTGYKTGSEIRDIFSIGVIKDVGKAYYTIRNKNYSVAFNVGEGQISKSIQREIRGLRTRQVFDLIMGKPRTIKKRLDIEKIYQYKGLRSNVVNGYKIENIAGFHKSLNENLYVYRGTTKKTKPIISSDLNIKGFIKLGNEVKEDYTGNLILKSGKVSKPIQKEIEKSLSSIATITKESAKTTKLKQDFITTQTYKSLPSLKIQEQSAYYGTGQYERTLGGLLPSNTGNLILKYKFESIQKEKVIDIVSPMLRTRQITIARQTPRMNIITGQKEILRQDSRLLQRLKLDYKLISSTKKTFKAVNFKIPITPKPIIPILPELFRIRGKGSLGYKKQYGYRTYYIRNGKKIFLSGVREKGQAIKYGESYVLKNLRATFGVRKTGKVITGKSSVYYPSSYLFRSYRIKKGKAIPLADEFIQRRGKRLYYKPEIKELQSYRRMKI